MTKILLIEDDLLMVRLYQKVFTFEKYEIETAMSGQEGLDKARSSKPALILLDIMMPKMSGLEVLDKLKADPETKGIPVVTLTNLAAQKDAQAALAKGAVKHIIKSEHEPKEIVNIVRGILGEQPEAGEKGQALA